MEPTFIAIQFESGHIAIMQLFIEPTPENITNEVQRSDFGSEVYASHTVINKEDVPTDRTWRGAWRLVDSRISPDLAAAKSLALDGLRFHRAPILLKLDVEHLRATETNDATRLEAVLAKKQYWRDITADTTITDAPDLDSLQSAFQAIITNATNLPAKSTNHR